MTAMRRNYFTTVLQLLAVVLMLSVIGCSKEEKATPAPEEQKKVVVPQDPTNLKRVTPKRTQHSGKKKIKAGLNSGPRTLTSLQLGTSSAKVLWNAGDSFESYFIYESDIYYDVFTTTQEGVTKADFTAQWGLDDADKPFYHFYPQAAKLAQYGDEIIIGLNVPELQDAIADGVDEDILFSFAYGATADQDLTFYNVPALIKFKLSGGIVPQVKKVKFEASVPIAGDVVIHNVGGVGEVYTGIHFSGDEEINHITLMGDFTAGDNYFMVAVPAELTGGFTMTFTDQYGTKSTVKTYGASSSATKVVTAPTVTLSRSTITDLGTINLGDEFDNDDSDLAPVLYMEHTAGTKAATFAVLAEGFRREELSSFQTLAQSAIDALFEVEPYKSYKQYFDVWILPVASNESGANITDGNGNITTARDCYFGSKWGVDSYSDMSSNTDAIIGFLESTCPPVVSGELEAYDVPVALVINDSRYGGMCWSYSNGWCYAMIPVAYNGGAMSWSYPNIVPVSMVDDSGGYRATKASEKTKLGTPNTGTWKNTFCHEFGGHGFGRLGDEYWYTNNTATTTLAQVHDMWPVPFKMNLSDSYTTVPWQILLDNKTALVAQDSKYDRISIYQAGDVYMFGRWRNEEISAMIDNRFYFSAWQRYLIAQRIMKLAGMESTFNYNYWLARDVTTDPNRDGGSSSVVMQTPVLGEIHYVQPCPPPREVTLP